MNSILIIAGAVVAGGGVLPYVAAIIKGTVRPRMVSWGVWAVLSGVMAGSAYIDNATASAVLSFEAFVSCMLVVILGWRRRSKEIGTIDIICLFGAILGLISLIAFRSSTTALIVSVVVDAIAFVPTIAHAWKCPLEESLACFLLASIGATLTLTASLRTDLTIASLLYPIYSIIFNGIVAVLLLMGRTSTAFEYPYNNEEV